MTKMRGLVFCFALLLAPLAAQSAPVFTNSSFETGTYYVLDPTDVTGWTFSGGARLFSTFEGSGFDGSQFAGLGEGISRTR